MRVSILIAALALSGAAAADTAYIEPSTFTPEIGHRITVEAAFNDICCEPKYAVRSNAYVVIGPDGEAEAPDRMETFATATILEHGLDREGTTRISTGERLGRKGGEYVLVDGAYKSVVDEDGRRIEIPPGAQILSSQTATVSDVYLTIGEPSWEPVLQTIGRLEVAPQKHPSTLAVGDSFAVVARLDGVPLVDQTVLLTWKGGDETGETFQTGAGGNVTIPLIRAGTHVLMTRRQAPAPDGAETDLRSYTTALTFYVSP